MRVTVSLLLLVTGAMTVTASGGQHSPARSQSGGESSEKPHDDRFLKGKLHGIKNLRAFSPTQISR
jgi:hypothetical protein